MQFYVRVTSTFKALSCIAGSMDYAETQSTKYKANKRKLIRFASALRFRTDVADGCNPREAGKEVIRLVPRSIVQCYLDDGPGSARHSG